MTFNLSMRTSSVSASVARPGTSSLVATHTFASSSHIATISKFGMCRCPGRLPTAMVSHRMLRLSVTPRQRPEASGQAAAHVCGYLWGICVDDRVCLLQSHHQINNLARYRAISC